MNNEQTAGFSTFSIRDQSQKDNSCMETCMNARNAIWGMEMMMPWAVLFSKKGASPFKKNILAFHQHSAFPCFSGFRLQFCALVLGIKSP